MSVHTVRTKGSYGGIEFEFPVAYVWTFRNGKIIHFRSARDPEEALASVDSAD